MGRELGSGRRVRGKRDNRWRSLNHHCTALGNPACANVCQCHYAIDCFVLNLFGDWVTLSQVALSDGVTAPTVGY